MSQLLDQMGDRLRTLHYSIRTEDAYMLWAKQFILFQRKRHPLEMGEAEVGEFLTYLAVERNVAASTQSQALSAILLLYKVVLDRHLERVDDVLRAKKPQRLPVVFTREEVRAVLARMQGDKALMTSLLYGSGLRLMECLRLRVKDVDIGQNHIVVRDGGDFGPWSLAGGVLGHASSWPLTKLLLSLSCHDPGNDRPKRVVSRSEPVRWVPTRMRYSLKPQAIANE